MVENDQDHDKKPPQSRILRHNSIAQHAARYSVRAFVFKAAKNDKFAIRKSDV